jgi:hypothetical protein
LPWISLPVKRMGIHVNLYNDGLLGAYIFNKTGAQLTILTIPQG